MALLARANEVLEQQFQSREDDELCTHVKSKVEQVRASANRIAHEAIWMTNIAYLLGFDGLSYSSNSRQFIPVNRASNYLKKNRIHVNKILPTIQNRLSRLCKNPPRYDVRPDTQDTDAKEDARYSLQVLGSLWEKLKLDEKRIPLFMWTQECGHAYVKICWDDTSGRMIKDPQTGEDVFEGEVRAEVVSPFEVFPDPLAKTLDEASYIIHAKIRSLEYFKAHYPEKGHLVKEESAWLLSMQYEQRINSLNSRGPSQGGLQDQLKNTAIELVKYEKPRKEYPNGRMISTANGVLLEDKELPCGEIPFAKFDDILIGGKYYSEAIITHLRPIQDQYNETIRRRAEWTKRLLAGKYITARGSAIAQESLNDESGEVTYYTPVPNAPNGGMPTPMQVPMIPQWAYQEEQALDKMFAEISGISEVSKGQLPSASIPAIGMQLLVEQDDTRIGVMTEQHEQAWAHVGGLILKYVQKYYKLARKLKSAGKSLAYTVQEVSGDKIKNTDVMVIRGSTVPGSKTLKRQDIMNTYKEGLLGDPNDPKIKEKVLGMIEFGDVQGLWQDYGLDMAQIQRGIDALEVGEVIPVNLLDNHDSWITELNRYRKSDKFDTLDETVKQNFITCINDHIDAQMKLSGQANNVEVAQDYTIIHQDPAQENQPVTPLPPPPDDGMGPPGLPPGPGMPLPPPPAPPGLGPAPGGPAGQQLSQQIQNRLPGGVK